MKNTITTNGHVKIECPFCCGPTKHQINFKCYGFNSAVQKQDVHFYKTCTSCDRVQSVLTVMIKDDYENLQLAK